MKKSTSAVVAGCATLALAAGASLTWSPSEAASGAHRAPDQRAVSAKTSTGPVKCDGGKAKSLTTRLQADPFSFAGTSGADVAVPGAQVTVRGPSKGTDTLLVTFTAETYYSGTGWMGLEIHKDGVPIAPFANNGSPFALSSDAAYHGDGAQFCTKIGKGVHTISVQTNTTGDSTESGWIDDWAMSVQRFS
jgi:uncharacterized low-complexity protein